MKVVLKSTGCGTRPTQIQIPDVPPAVTLSKLVKSQVSHLLKGCNRELRGINELVYLNPQKLCTQYVLNNLSDRLWGVDELMYLSDRLLGNASFLPRSFSPYLTPHQPLPYILYFSYTRLVSIAQHTSVPLTELDALSEKLLHCLILASSHDQLKSYVLSSVFPKCPKGCHALICTSRATFTFTLWVPHILQLLTACELPENGDHVLFLLVSLAPFIFPGMY